MPKPRCICGCGRRAGHDHHVIYRQELRQRATLERTYCQLEVDRRNIVRVAFDCHGGHHNASKRLLLSVLPDPCFEFAGELMGPAAFDYLRRRYSGEDARLEALLSS